jgi:hypothetical protein
VDTDFDGYNDTASVNLTVINDDVSNDSYCCFDALLIDPENNLAARHHDDESSKSVILAGTTFYKNIDLTVPATSPAGKYTLALNTDPYRQGTYSNQTTIDLYPRGRYSPVLTPISNTSATVHPTQTETFVFNVTNNGNNPDRIAFSAFSSLNWSISLDINSTKLIQPGETSRLSICVTVPAIVDPDIEDVERIIAISTKDPIKNSTILLKTRSAPFLADFEIICSNSNQTVELWGAIFFPISIVNYGEYTDRINLFLKMAGPTGWSIRLDIQQLTILPGSESSTIFLDVRAPETIPREMNIIITVGGRSKDGVTIRSLKINATLSIADLAFNGDIVINPENPIAGAPVNLSANITNIGTKTANNVRISCYLGDTQVDSRFIFFLPHGAVEKISKTLVARPGLSIFRMVIDPENEQMEFNESNNEALKSLSVMAPDLSVFNYEVALSKERPNEGDTIEINATIHNLGDCDGVNVTVWLLVDNKSADEKRLDILLGDGGIDNPTFSWIAINGTHSIAIMIDPLNTIPEMNEDNNEANISIHVNSIPIARLDVKSQMPAGDRVDFSAANLSDIDGLVSRYRFFFGDGGDSGWIPVPSANHTYNVPGKYNVKLMVMDNDGTMSMESNATVQVLPKQDREILTTLVLGIVILTILIIAIFATKGKKSSK